MIYSNEKSLGVDRDWIFHVTRMVYDLKYYHKPIIEVVDFKTSGFLMILKIVQFS